MRLDTHIGELNGVGEKHEKALLANGICTVRDLLYYLPRAYQNRSDVKELNQEEYYNQYHSYILTVTKEPTVAMIRRGMTLLKFQAIDDTGKVNITFFNQNYLRDVFHVGGASLSQGNPKKTYLNFRNNLLLLHKNMPVKEGKRKLFIRRLYDTLAWIMFILKFDLKNANAILKAHKDFRKMKKNYTAHPETNFLKKLPGANRNIIIDYYLKRKKK